MGFMNMLLSISGNYPLDSFSAVTFLFGVVLFVHGTVQTWHRWIVVGMAVALAAVILIRGEVGTWTQIGLFYGTLLVVLFYIFFAREPKLDEDATHKGTGTGN
jgi:hypothetical protein